MSATTKMILAIPTADEAMPAKPKTAAMRAMIKNVIAQENMAISYGYAS
jgi:hypothetical protein